MYTDKTQPVFRGRFTRSSRKEMREERADGLSKSCSKRERDRKLLANYTVRGPEQDLHKLKIQSIALESACSSVSSETVFCADELARRYELWLLAREAVDLEASGRFEAAELLLSWGCFQELLTGLSHDEIKQLMLFPQQDDEKEQQKLLLCSWLRAQLQGIESGRIRPLSYEQRARQQHVQLMRHFQSAEEAQNARCLRSKKEFEANMSAAKQLAEMEEEQIPEEETFGIDLDISNQSLLLLEEKEARDIVDEDDDETFDLDATHQGLFGDQAPAEDQGDAEFAVAELMMRSFVSRSAGSRLRHSHAKTAAELQIQWRQQQRLLLRQQQQQRQLRHLNEEFMFLPPRQKFPGGALYQALESHFDVLQRIDLLGASEKRQFHEMWHSHDLIAKMCQRYSPNTFASSSGGLDDDEDDFKEEKRNS
jgi:hypothetical protein